MNKTLVITLEFPPQIGGIASYIFDYVEAAGSRNFVLYAPPVMGYKEFDKSNKFITYRFKPYFLFFWPRWTKMIWQIYWLVKKESIKQIHIHHALPVGYVGLFIKKLLKIPYTIFLHGSDYQLAAQKKGKLKKLTKVCLGAKQVIVNSKFSETFVKRKIEGLKNVTIVYPCPNTNFFSSMVDEQIQNKLRRSLGVEGKKVIVSAARIVDRKGHLLLAAMLPLILKQVSNVVWLVIGDGPKQKELVEILDRLGLKSIVRFLPAMVHKDLINYYHLSHLFVLLTHKDEDGVEEAWGTTFVEAAAAGLPVVAGQSGGVEESVLHLKTGLVVNALNQKEVINSVVQLLNNFEYSKKMGQAGKLRAQSDLLWAEQIKKLEQ